MIDRESNGDGGGRRPAHKAGALPKRIRILIADDHPVVRSGIRCALDVQDMEVVGEAGTGPETLAAAAELHPDVLILDIQMPEMDGIQVLGRIKAEHPELAVIVLTSYADPQYMKGAILGGAAAFLLKATGNDELIAAVRRVADGDSVVEVKTLKLLLEGAFACKSPSDIPLEAPSSSLTKREFQILRAIRAGLRNAEIASLLGLSPSTVKSHCYRLYHKINVSDRTQALLWAARHGIGPL